MKIVTNFEEEACDRIYLRGCKTLEEKLTKIYTALRAYYKSYVGDDIEVRIFPNDTAVYDLYERYYGIRKKYHAFCSGERNLVVFSVDRLNKDVVKHELAHLIVKKHLKKYKNLTVNMHEILAQTAERYADI